MIRTDLALEARESFPEDDVEIQGVILEEEKKGETITTTTMEIKDDKAAKRMGKPVGTYITIETKDPDQEEELRQEVMYHLKRLILDKEGVSILIAGLGNRQVTPDALGPMVVDKLFTTRHLIRELGEDFRVEYHIEDMSAIAPGVMGQTGIETGEILKGIIGETHPDCVVVVDALAARSIRRLHRTVQITDTGINPGAGIGNNRNGLNKKTLGIPVVAVGVPTVVDASTIVEDRMRELLHQQGVEEDETERFVNSLNSPELGNFFVTPKDVDESVEKMSGILAEALNSLTCPIKIV